MTSAPSPQTALLVGAAGGILQDVADGLAAQGCQLILFDRDEARLEEMAARLRGRVDVETVVGDITKTAEAEQLLSGLQRKPSILINGVGGDTRVIPYAELDQQVFETSYLENVIGTFTAIKVLAPSMVEAGYGRIVNFASAGGRTYSHFNNAAYVAAKAAVIGMTKQIAYELAPTGVSVNVVAHGPIATARVAGAWERRDPAQKEAVLSKLPMRRMGTVHEAVGSVLYLASESAGFTTGSVIDINGGLYM
ncbi:SDR family oxidoreductase [Arthrobacter russicus]|uniref:3-oxoacyl-[acyl-carrier protein] reductase n=1 Tax=Arthrobacter russicus TaxID=172040 RepID=A0ABU1JBM4_9MICC|nr:SDR family oxidoreductase [Arthrobacter russicus]MBQ1445406.1 SDR family oxidoreductase [Renibacterium sp.]MDN5669149.1 SDR family oxidoreductase [Renibacterium salmoninarum]MDR6268851.1 3-oxoacyl-[acyl-carrier protein] reductase [Arthrobacter russicus]